MACRLDKLSSLWQNSFMNGYHLLKMVQFVHLIKKEQFPCMYYAATCITSHNPASTMRLTDALALKLHCD
uniref:Uncharacterized protein n=1 Tax=Dicentrarchus labrax TaxID=13489 RepID=A0A8C4I8L0_DICLA